jgi:hypothetical protein
MVTLAGLGAILGLTLAWEFTTPEATPLLPDTASPARPARTVEAGKPRRFDADALADIAVSINQRPLFSPDRRPARVTAAATGAQAARDDVPRLTGVIIGPSGGWAIFAGADGKSHAAAKGDAVGAFKVRAIGPGVVTLTGSEGDRVLHPTYVAAAGAGSSEVTSSDFTPPGANRDARSGAR